MGRHARGARLQRVPIATIVLGSLVVAVVGVGTWAGLKPQPIPSAATVDASAVVVSSPTCAASGGRTVVDVLDMGATETGGTTRAELDACGYHEGQVLAVQHAVGDPTQVVIAKAADPSADLQPLGMLAALLLAIAAAVAVWYDGRAGRLFSRARRIDLPGGFGESTEPGTVQAGLSAGWIGSPTASDAEDAPASRTGRHARIDPTETEVLLAELIDAPVVNSADLDDNAAPKEVDLVFGFGTDFAASLRDELFTHRGAPSLP